MQTSFGAIASESLARSLYDALQQTGHIYPYAADRKKLIQLMMRNLPEADIDRQFVRNFKHEAQGGSHLTRLLKWDIIPKLIPKLRKFIPNQHLAEKPQAKGVLFAPKILRPWIIKRTEKGHE